MLKLLVATGCLLFWFTSNSQDSSSLRRNIRFLDSVFRSLESSYVMKEINIVGATALTGKYSAKMYENTNSNLSRKLIINVPYSETILYCFEENVICICEQEKKIYAIGHDYYTYDLKKVNQDKCLQRILNYEKILKDVFKLLKLTSKSDEANEK